MDAACAFAKNAVQTRYEDIPPEAIRVAKTDVLDVLACALGGSTADGIPEIVSLAKDLSGKQEVSLFVYGDKVSLLEGVLANGAMTNALDYDSAHENARLHAGVTTISTALAVAEWMGGVSGKDFLTAITLGNDLICRMGLAYPAYPAGFSWTLVYGFFGAALTAAKLLGLDAEQTISALGNGYVQAAGNQQPNLDGTLAKRMGVGLSARGGILGALMARKGITGATNSIEGKRGFYNTYNRGKYDPKPLTDRLGERFEGAGISFKPYPTCRFNHGHIDAALALARTHDIRPDEIDSILAYVDREDHSQFDPLEVKRNPRNIIDAQFSMPYTVALALIKKRVVIDDFTPEAIRNPVVLDLAKKVSPAVDASLGEQIPAISVLEVRTKRGTFTQRVEFPYGHPANPISDEALAEKVRDCAAHAARPISEAKVAELIASAGRIEALNDIRSLIDLVH